MSDFQIPAKAIKAGAVQPSPSAPWPFDGEPQAGEAGILADCEALVDAGQASWLERPKGNSDAAWLLRLLWDGAEHSLAEILRRSNEERGHGLTVHSRASELREQGHDVRNRAVKGAPRGQHSVWWLSR